MTYHSGYPHAYCLFSVCYNLVWRRHAWMRQGYRYYGPNALWLPTYLLLVQLVYVFEYPDVCFISCLYTFRTWEAAGAI